MPVAQVQFWGAIVEEVLNLLQSFINARRLSRKSEREYPLQFGRVHHQPGPSRTPREDNEYIHQPIRGMKSGKRVA